MTDTDRPLLNIVGESSLMFVSTVAAVTSANEVEAAGKVQTVDPLRGKFATLTGRGTVTIDRAEAIAHLARVCRECLKILEADHG